MDLMPIFKMEELSNLTGEDFWWKRPEITITYSIPIITSIITGTFGNILTFITILSRKSLQNPGNYFIVNLCIADFIISCFVGPMNLVGIFMGEDYFTNRPALCDFTACLCLWVCFTSVWNILTIAISRFICITLPIYYDRVYNKTNSILFCMLVWLAAMLLNSPNFTGWANYYFERKTRSCLWNRKASLSYTLFFSVIGIGLPLVATLFLYIYTFRHVWLSSKRIQAHIVTNFEFDFEDSKRKNQAIRNNLKLAKTMALIYISFLLNWGPYVIITSIDVNDEFPPYFLGLSLIFAHFNSSINTLIYGFTNTTFRTSYLQLISLKCLNLGNLKRHHSKPKLKMHIQNIIKNIKSSELYTSQC